MENKYCWNCTEDEETGDIGADGLCDTCRELYLKVGTSFKRCCRCGGLVEYGGKNKTKKFDGCNCKTQFADYQDDIKKAIEDAHEGAIRQTVLIIKGVIYIKTLVKCGCSWVDTGLGIKYTPNEKYILTHDDIPLVWW